MPVYSSTLNRYLPRESLTVKASGAQTSSTTGASIEVVGSFASLTLAVTSVAGTTPTLDVRIEGSADGTTWHTLGTFTQKTGVSSEAKAFLVDRFVRYVSTIGGTDSPSFTYSVTGDLAQ